MIAVGMALVTAVGIQRFRGIWLVHNYNGTGFLDFLVTLAASFSVILLSEHICKKSSWARKTSAGEGYADVVYLPKHDSDWPALVIELKWKKGAEGAIAQILSKKYPESLKDYGSEVMLVGISYDKEGSGGNRKHRCKITKACP